MARQCSESPGDALSANSAILTGPPFTAFAWLKTSDVAADRQQIFSFGELGTDNFFRARLRDDPLIEFSAEEDGGAAADADTTDGPSTDDVWATVAAVASAVDSRDVYFNGGDLGSNTDTVEPENLDGTEVGQSDDGSDNDRFIGDLGHVAVYGVALALGMLDTLAAGFNPLRVQRGDLIGYFPLNGQDPEPNAMGGFPLPLVGAPAVAENPPIRRFNVAPA
jgi:hypothetical protein